MTTSQTSAAAQPDQRVERIGRATSRLHKLLKELGHKRNLEQTASTMPDARERLSFIDQSMHEASEKTISAVEASIPITSNNSMACADLATRLADAAFSDNQELVSDAISLMGEVVAGQETLHHNLMQIMEAQEFRDVAGQMVNKIVDAAVEIESILLDILKEYAPNSQDSLINKSGLTSGPAMQSDNAVNGQDEVDDLLASLGL